VLASGTIVKIFIIIYEICFGLLFIILLFALSTISGNNKNNNKDENKYIYSYNNNSSSSSISAISLFAFFLLFPIKYFIFCTFRKMWNGENIFQCLVAIASRNNANTQTHNAHTLINNNEVAVEIAENLMAKHSKWWSFISGKIIFCVEFE
jgi:hypothetical protein